MDKKEVSNVSKEYWIEFKQMSDVGVVTSKGCNAIIFTNRGVATAYVNNEPIATDQSISIASLQGEKDMTEYRIKFAAVGSKSLYIKIKWYK